MIYISISSCSKENNFWKFNQIKSLRGCGRECNISTQQNKEVCGPGGSVEHVYPKNKQEVGAGGSKKHLYLCK